MDLNKLEEVFEEYKDYLLKNQPKPEQKIIHKLDDFEDMKEGGKYKVSWASHIDPADRRPRYAAHIADTKEEAEKVAQEKSHLAHIHPTYIRKLIPSKQVKKGEDDWLDDVMEEQEGKRKPPEEQDLEPHITPKDRKSINRIERVQKYDEVVKYDDNGQWKIEKSSYGPKGWGMYSDKDNAPRKAKLSGEQLEGVGPNARPRAYTSAKGGTAKEQADKQAKVDAEKNKKQPVKVGTPEEIAEMNRKLREKD